MKAYIYLFAVMNVIVSGFARVVCRKGSQSRSWFVAAG